MKMMGLGKFLCRKGSMKIYATNMYYSLISSRNHHKAASTHSFTSFRRDHCYVQTSPSSYVPENPQPKYHGTEEKTKRSLDLLFNKGCDQLSEELKPIRKGDVINLHDLLFTKDRDYLVRYKDDQQVRFSQLVGKRIILFFEGNDFQQEVVEFLIVLEKRYLDTKNTSDEFEVIYITNSKHESPYIERIPCMEWWFVSISPQLLSIDRSLYRCYCHLKPRPYCHYRSCFGGSSILAFDQDGKIVRKSLDPSFNDIDFPFYVGGMQQEAFYGLNHVDNWWALDFYHQGLLINSYYRNTNLRWLTDYY